MNLRWLLEKIAGHFGVDTESLLSDVNYFSRSATIIIPGSPLPVKA